jgi:hypothetical protein
MNLMLDEIRQSAPEDAETIDQLMRGDSLREHILLNMNEAGFPMAGEAGAR